MLAEQARKYFVFVHPGGALSTHVWGICDDLELTVEGLLIVTTKSGPKGNMESKIYIPVPEGLTIKWAYVVTGGFAGPYKTLEPGGKAE